MDIASFEKEVFLLGHWDNYDDLEEKLSLDELIATLEAVREREHRHNKFLASLKGIDLDEGSKKESMSRVREEMKKIEEAKGKPASPRKKKDEFAEFGIAVVEGDSLN